jgi:hypothetical protein
MTSHITHSLTSAPPQPLATTSSATPGEHPPVYAVNDTQEEKAAAETIAAMKAATVSLIRDATEHTDTIFQLIYNVIYIAVAAAKKSKEVAKKAAHSAGAAAKEKYDYTNISIRMDALEAGASEGDAAAYSFMVANDVALVYLEIYATVYASGDAEDAHAAGDDAANCVIYFYLMFYNTVHDADAMANAARRVSCIYRETFVILKNAGFSLEEAKNAAYYVATKVGDAYCTVYVLLKDNAVSAKAADYAAGVYREVYYTNYANLVVAGNNELSATYFAIDTAYQIMRLYRTVYTSVKGADASADAADMAYKAAYDAACFFSHTINGIYAAAMTLGIKLVDFVPDATAASVAVIDVHLDIYTMVYAAAKTAGVSLEYAVSAAHDASAAAAAVYLKVYVASCANVNFMQQAFSKAAAAANEAGRLYGETYAANLALGTPATVATIAASAAVDNAGLV